MLDRKEAARRIALNAMRLTGAAPLAAPFLSGVGAILMLHRVSAEPPKPLGVNRHLTVTPGFLDRLLGKLKRKRYAFVTMDEAIEALVTGRGRRFLAVTADDAYRDNFTEALPVLEHHDVPIAIHVCPGLASRRVDLWWDVLEDVVCARDRLYLDTAEGRVAFDCGTLAAKHETVRAIHDHLTTVVREEERQTVLRDLARSVGVDHAKPSRDTLMDWNEIRRAAQHRLVTIGAHTVNHYNLRRLSAEAALREMADAARIIELELGRRPVHMAYPYGYESAVGPREVALAAEAGYRSAVTTRHGVLQREHAGHLHSLPRISVNGRYQRLAHVRTMLSGLTTPLANAGRRLVTV